MQIVILLPTHFVKPCDVLLDKRPLAPRRFVDHPIDRRQARREIASGIRLGMQPASPAPSLTSAGNQPRLAPDRVIGKVFGYKVGRWLAKLFALHVY